MPTRTHTQSHALVHFSSRPLMLAVAYGSCRQLINCECHSVVIERKHALNRLRDQSRY